MAHAARKRAGRDKRSFMAPSPRVYAAMMAL
jgi:hypothetical protein